MSQHLAFDSTLEADQPNIIEHNQRRALRSLLLVFSYSVPAITGWLFLDTGLTLLTGLTAALGVFVWLLWIPMRLEREQFVAHAMVIALLAAGTLALYHQGTVRSSSVLGILAAVLIAGSFLPRPSMIGVGIYCIAALGYFNWMEQQAMLTVRMQPVGWGVWMVQATVVMGVLVSLFHGRRRLLKACNIQAQSLLKIQAAKDDLRASDNRFKVLFRRSPSACVVQSIDTRAVIDANDAFFKLTGYSREDMLGHEPPPMWAHANQQQDFRERLFRDGFVHGLRATGVHKDGSHIEILLSAELLTEGFEQLVILILLDVTAEVRSREALEQSRERFSTAFSFSPLGTMIRRLSDDRILEANPAIEQVLGYRGDELVGHRPQELGIWMTEAEERACAAELDRHGQLMGFPTRLRNKQGEAVDVQLWSRRIELDGDACELIYSINLTEQKRRETMLLSVARGVSSKTGEAFFLSLAQRLAQGIDADGVLIGEVDKNGQIDTLSLMEQGVIQPNRNLPLASHTGLSDILRQDDLMVIEAPPDRMVPSIAATQPDALLTLAGVALRDADGSAIGLMAVVWRERRELPPDVRALLTIFASRCNAELVRLRRDREIHRLQATLEQRVTARTQQLEYLNRELESFSYSVSHDLKSPLRTMDGFTHMLREQLSDRLTPQDEDLIVRIQNAVARMNSLITDLLALARVSQGQLQRMEVNLSEFANDVIRHLRHTDPGRDVQVVIAPELMAHCDARMAHIVLENLVGNAWKYSRQRTPAVIEFSADATPRPPGSAPWFQIRDNGAGFDMTRYDRLFKPFTRLHAATEFEGSGIGLATVRRIIERHGGHIKGNASPGEGACFTFTFGNGTST